MRSTVLAICLVSVFAAACGTDSEVDLGTESQAVALGAITVFDGGGQHQEVDGDFASLVVVVRDGLGNPLSGRTVTFTAPATGATAELGSATAITDLAGKASVTARAGVVAGSYPVSASAPGASSTTFTLENVAGPVDALTLVSGDVQDAEVVRGFELPLVVHARDRHDNPVAGASITFSAPTQGATVTVAATAATELDGRATVDVTAGQRAGTTYVIASIAESSSVEPVTFHLVNHPGAATAVIVAGGDGKGAAVTTTFGGPLAVFVRDAFGNPVSGVPVTFAAPAPADATATATLTGSPATSDADGLAEVGAIAGTVAGGYQVTAALPGGATTTFELTNLAGAPATITLIGGGGQDAVVTASFDEPVVFEVRDAHQNLVPDATVELQAPRSGATAGVASSLTTGADGRVAVTVTASSVAGSYPLTATAGPSSATATLQNRPDAPFAITVAPASSPQTATVHARFSEPLAASVTDRFGNPTPGASVTFTAPSPTARAVATAAFGTTPGTTVVVADETGHVETSATAGGVAGAYLVTATIDGVGAPGVFSLSNLAGAPATLGVAGGGERDAVVDTTFAEPLTVVALDADGNPVKGAAITFTAPTSGATAVLAASAVATDVDGVATVDVRAGTVTGGYQVTAVLGDSATPAVFELRNTPDAPATITAGVMATPQQTAVSTRFTQLLVAGVSDRFGNAVPGVAVEYRAPDRGATGAPRVETATTDEDGHTAIAFTAGSVAGSYQVTATADGVTSPAVFELTNRSGAAHLLTAESGGGQHAVVAGGFDDAVVARVEDVHGNPVAGAVVTFTVPEGGATAALAATTVTSDADGRARTTLVAGTVSGAYQVLATADVGAAPAAFALRNLAGAPFAIGAVAGSTPQTAEVAHAFAARLAVRVIDKFGNPVPGTRVVYGAPGASPRAVLELGEARTGDDGVAAVRAVADTVAGRYTVSASVAGLEAHVDFTLTQVAAAPAVVVVTDGGGQRALATTGFAAPIGFRVLDGLGNPVGGVALTITTPASGPTVTMVTGTRYSEADGRVPVMFAAGAEVGEVDITATVLGAAVPVTARVTVDAIPTTITATGDEAGTVSVVVDASIGTPAGTVEIVADGVVVDTATLTAGAATVDLSLGQVGGRTVVARFAAQGSFGASTSATITIASADGGDSLSGGGCDAGGAGGAGTGVLVAVVLAMAALVRRGREPATARRGTMRR